MKPLSDWAWPAFAAGALILIDQIVSLAASINPPGPIPSGGWLAFGVYLAGRVSIVAIACALMGGALLILGRRQQLRWWTGLVILLALVIGAVAIGAAVGPTPALPRETSRPEALVAATAEFTKQRIRAVSACVFAAVTLALLTTGMRAAARSLDSEVGGQA